MPDFATNLTVTLLPLAVAGICQIAFRLMWARIAIWIGATFLSFMFSGEFWTRSYLQASGCIGDGFKSSFQCPEWNFLTEIAAFQASLVASLTALALAAVVFVIAVVSELVVRSMS